MTEQLELLVNNQVPDYVLDAIAWAKCEGGELVVMVNGSYGVGTWLRENLQIKAIAPCGEQVAVKAVAPSWAGELRCKRWQGASGSNHPANYINW